MLSKHTSRLIALAGACLFAGIGCQTTTVPQSTLPRLAGNDPQIQLDYWHELAGKELINNDEALHGILLYLDGKDDCTSYDQRVAALKSRGYLHKSFKQPADQAVERGTIAVVLVKSLNLKGGLTMRLFGDTPRYATKELMYRDIYPMSGTDQVFTGAQFVGVIGKAEDYKLGDPSSLPASAMPEPMVAENDEVTPILAMIAPDPSTLSLNPATTAATQGASGALTAKITAVQGLCSVRADENSPWQPAKVGMELNENAEFRTGPTGTIQFVISNDQTICVDRLTTAKLLTAVQKGGKVTTDIGIKYGRTRYDLEGGGLEHQSTLRSPNATLAVRGTKVSLFDQPPFTPQATSLTGRAEFKAQRRRAGVAFGNRGQGKTVVNANSVNAGDLALRQSVVDPTLQGARTESEQALLTTVISRGAVVELDRDSGIPIVKGGVPPTNAELIPALPGKLNIVMRWTGNVDLNLGVSTPGTEQNLQSEFVYPARGLNVSSTGKTAFDHQGGPNGGIEVVYFNEVRDGLYKIAGPIITPGGTSTATLEAFMDGKNIDLADLGTLTITPIVTQSIDANNPALAILAINAPLPFGGLPAKVASRRESLKFMGPLPVAPPVVKKPVNAAAVTGARALSKK
jgi:hypothetical protein